MRIRLRCGCGVINYNRVDWIVHFRRGNLWGALKDLFNTRIEIQR
jgi:hypothetical protein